MSIANILDFLEFQLFDFLAHFSNMYSIRSRNMFDFVRVCVFTFLSIAGDGIFFFLASGNATSITITSAGSKNSELIHVQMPKDTYNSHACSFPAK